MLFLFAVWLFLFRTCWGWSRVIVASARWFSRRRAFLRHASAAHVITRCLRPCLHFGLSCLVLSRCFWIWILFCWSFCSETQLCLRMVAWPKTCYDVVWIVTLGGGTRLSPLLCQYLFLVQTLLFGGVLCFLVVPTCLFLLFSPSFSVCSRAALWRCTLQCRLANRRGSPCNGVCSREGAFVECVVFAWPGTNVVD